MQARVGGKTRRQARGWTDRQTDDQTYKYTGGIDRQID